MSDGICLVTGATGLLGSHLVERLIERGDRVRALVRPGNSAESLAHELVEIVRGDLLSPASLDAAVRGVSTVYHCAARLGDWGPWSNFVSGSIASTSNLVDACQKAEVDRFLHVSSMAVYGRPRKPVPGKCLDEQTPVGQNFRWWDYYGMAKLAAESQASRLGRRSTIVRPTWFYGPQDRTILPRMLRVVRNRRAAIIGTGANLLNLLHAHDIAQGVILAANNQASGGEIFNFVSSGEISQRGFFDLMADLVHAPRVQRKVPFRIADSFAAVLEIVGRAIGQSKPPSITRGGIALLNRPVFYSGEKARRLLGWQPRVPIESGLRESIEWIARQEN